MRQRNKKHEGFEFFFEGAFLLNHSKLLKNTRPDVALWNRWKLRSGRFMISWSATASWWVYRSYNAADEITARSRGNFHRNFRPELRESMQNVGWSKFNAAEPLDGHWSSLRWRKSVGVAGKENRTGTAADLREGCAEGCVERTTKGQRERQKRVVEALWRSGEREREIEMDVQNRQRLPRTLCTYEYVRVNRMLVQRTPVVEFIRDWRWNRFVNHVTTAFRVFEERDFAIEPNPPGRSVNPILLRYLSLSLSSLSPSFFRSLKKPLADSMELPPAQNRGESFAENEKKKKKRKFTWKFRWTVKGCEKRGKRGKCETVWDGEGRRTSANPDRTGRRKRKNFQRHSRPRSNNEHRRPRNFRNMKTAARIPLIVGASCWNSSSQSRSGEPRTEIIDRRATSRLPRLIEVCTPARR